MIAVFDIETNGLYDQADKLHCISIKVDDEPTYVYTSHWVEGSDGDLQEAYSILNDADLLVGHNIINFDIPMLQKLGYDLTHKEVHDTILMSRLTFPNLMLQDANRKSVPPKLKGSHSLKAWGYRLRKLKGEFGADEEQWALLTPDMVSYCRPRS